MGLNGPWLPIVLGCAAAIVLALIVRCRSRARRNWAQALSRLGLTVLFTAIVLALVGALFNNEYVFYTSWSDLLGSAPEDSPQHYGANAPTSRELERPAAHPGRTSQMAVVLPALAQPGSRLQKYVIPGPRRADGCPSAPRKV